MSEPAAALSSDEKVLNGLLLAVLFVAGVVLVREGPHFDNVLEGWPFFAAAFFVGMLLGFLCWTYSFGSTPTLKFTGSYRLPWLAALVLGLITTSSVSYINRTFAAPPDRTIKAEIDGVDEGRGDRWHVTVKMPDGQFKRLLITKPVADALKTAKMANIGIARGALGFDLMVKFEPAG